MLPRARWMLALALFLPAPALASELPVDAPCGGSERGIEGGVEGRVRDSAGLPLRAVTVLVLDVTEDAVLGGASTDQTGYFRVEPLPAGTVRIRFLQIGYEPAEYEIRVEAGARLRFDTELVTSAVALEGVGATGERSRARERFETGTGLTVRELARDEIRRLPGLAEADPIRALEVLPGWSPRRTFRPRSMCAAARRTRT
jgi:hypothetical protein